MSRKLVLALFVLGIPRLFGEPVTLPKILPVPSNLQPYLSGMYTANTTASATAGLCNTLPGGNTLPDGYPGTCTGGPGGDASIGFIGQAGRSIYEDTASASASIDIHGVHIKLRADADNYKKNVIPLSGAGAGGGGSVNEYFITSNLVIPGTEFVIYSHMTGTGSSHQSANLDLDPDSYGSFFALSVGARGAAGLGQTTCTGDDVPVNTLNGTNTINCATKISLFPNSQIWYLLSGIADVGTNGGAVYLDASHTASIDAAYATDSAGNILPNIQIYDASGIDYNSLSQETVTATPEPASVGLFALASSVLLGSGFVPKLKKRYSAHPGDVSSALPRHPETGRAMTK